MRPLITKMPFLKRMANFAYNIDRAMASLGGADPQATLSSEAGGWFSRMLNHFNKYHTEDAMHNTSVLTDAVNADNADRIKKGLRSTSKKGEGL